MVLTCDVGTGEEDNSCFLRLEESRIRTTELHTGRYHTLAERMFKWTELHGALRRFRVRCDNPEPWRTGVASCKVGTVEALGAGSGSTHLCLRDLPSKIRVSCVVFQKLQSAQCRARSLEMATRGRQPQEDQRVALKGRKRLNKTVFGSVFNGTLTQCFCSEDNNIKEGGGEDEAVCV